MSMTESERLTFKTDVGISIDKNEDCPTCSICWNCDRKVKDCNYFNDAVERLAMYEDIGTVSEFRELKEKATAKKPTDVRYFGEAGYYIGLCPTCKNGNNSEYEYCGDCGQKLQWFERSEGKE